MNIVVNTYSGATIVRPDTTWERDAEDFYLPDFVTEVSASIVACAHICKPGRSVGGRFMSRYLDKFGLGVLLFPENMISADSPESFAEASCVDHTSFIPMPDSDLNDLKGRVSFGNREIELPSDLQDIFAAALENVTKRVYIRIGDILAVELTPRFRILDRSENANKNISLALSAREIQNFNIIVE